jgi:hypothetical protein
MTITYSATFTTNDHNVVKSMKFTASLDAESGLEAHMEALEQIARVGGLGDANLRHMFNQWLAEHETDEQQAESVSDLLESMPHALRTKVLARWITK